MHVIIEQDYLKICSDVKRTLTFNKANERDYLQGASMMSIKKMMTLI